MPPGRRKNLNNSLGQREQQVIELLYKNGPSSAVEIQDLISEELNNTTIRTILRQLEKKNYICHEKQGKQFIYQPLIKKEQAAQNMFKKLVSTFYSGSVTDAVASLLDHNSDKLTLEESEELIKLIDTAKKINNHDI